MPQGKGKCEHKCMLPQINGTKTVWMEHGQIPLNRMIGLLPIIFSNLYKKNESVIKCVILLLRVACKCCLMVACFPKFTDEKYFTDNTR